MLNDFDTNRDIALKIIHNQLNIKPIEITRFPTGYCHSVYYIKAKSDEYVLRITSKENKRFYDGSIKWLNELAQFEIPIPKILGHGQSNNVYYALITYINGKDICDVYHTLNNSQKYEIVKEIVEIQRKVSTLSPVKINGSEDYSPAACMKDIEGFIQRSRENIMANKVFDPAVCDDVESLLGMFENYLANVKPVVFLDDISTKNVLIRNGKLVGIVDIDEMGYGDPLAVVGLMNMALLAMDADTKYIDYWLDEIHATAIQRKAVTFYTLLSCIDFMGERGMKFDNGKVVPVDQKEVELFNSIYRVLLSRF